MYSPNKSRRKYCYSVEAETLCEDEVNEHLQTAKRTFELDYLRDYELNKNMIRRDSYLNQISDIEENRKEQHIEFTDYQSKIQKNQKLSCKYGKQSRLTKIMNLKVKPTDCSKSKPEKIKEKFEQDQHHASNKSLHSNLNQSISRNKPSRFDKIMNIKVNKPNVCSTLVNYQPKKSVRLDMSVSKAKRDDQTGQDKENKVLWRKNSEYIQKDESLWKNSQRKRQMQLKQMKMAEQKALRQQRRKENMFDNLISKEIIKIERERQLNKRKTEGFSKYLYPFY